MSGTNTLIQSENALKGSNQSALRKSLYNANEEAIKISDRKAPNATRKAKKK